MANRSCRGAALLAKSRCGQSSRLAPGWALVFIGMMGMPAAAQTDSNDLFNAARRGDVDAVSRLLSGGADVNVQGPTTAQRPFSSPKHKVIRT